MHYKQMLLLSFLLIFQSALFAKEPTDMQHILAYIDQKQTESTLQKRDALKTKIALDSGIALTLSAWLTYQCKNGTYTPENPNLTPIQAAEAISAIIMMAYCLFSITHESVDAYYLKQAIDKQKK